MKIKISREQWEKIGKISGWTRKAAIPINQLTSETGYYISSTSNDPNKILSGIKEDFIHGSVKPRHL